jgi:hypothetical protein
MNDNPEEDLRKELIEDYFLEITEIIGGENLRTEIDFKDNNVYTAKLQINVSGLTNEQDLDHFISGLKSIIRRINIIEKDVTIQVAVELQGLQRNT